MSAQARKAERLLAILEGQPVIPVLKITNAADAVPLARALAKGGLPAIEITLRTPAALDAIRAAVDAVPEAIVGAGTILDAGQFDAAERAGARFVVSPGLTAQLAQAASRSETPLLPGAATPSEIMAAAEAGYSLLKFFPAEQAGGAAWLKALASPFAGVRFCPTGGIGPQNAADYLSLGNVVCVGGSWIAPEALVAAGKWDEITALAARAAALKRS